MTLNTDRAYHAVLLTSFLFFFSKAEPKAESTEILSNRNKAERCEIIAVIQASILYNKVFTEGHQYKYVKPVFHK